MKKKNNKSLTVNHKPKTNPELEGLDIKINALGLLETNIDIDKINSFLNKHVADKKLKSH